MVTLQLTVNKYHHPGYLLTVSLTVTTMVASSLNANDAMHLNQMLLLQLP